MSKERSSGGKIPRNVSGSDLVAALKVLGYQTVRQAGSHLRFTTQLNGTHHVTVPAHRPIKTGTLLGGILNPWRPIIKSRWMNYSKNWISKAGGNVISPRSCGIPHVRAILALLRS